MKLCLMMGGNEEGGLENHFIQICNALSRHHQVHAIAHPVYHHRFATAVSAHALDMTQSRNNPLLLYRVFKIIREISPDIVHAQANKATSILATLKPWLPRTTRHIATLHSMKRTLSAYEKMDAVIGVSSRVLQTLNNPKTYVIYNGIHPVTDHELPRSLLHSQFNIPEKAPVFVAIGRLVSVKRFDILIEAFKGVNKAHLLIIGEGRERKSLEQQAARLHLHTIHFLGHRTDAIKILSAADLCIISSEREGFSYVMAESLLIRTPVIATDVADMKRILPPASVVPVNDPQSLHHVLVNALDHYDTFSRQYSASYAWAQSNLTFDHMLQQTEQVYTEVLS